MTPHPQEPCDHHAVCKIRIDKSCLVEQGKGCMFYSRPHTHTPAPQRDSNVPDMFDTYPGEYSCITPKGYEKFPYCAPCEEDRPDCNKCIKSHAAAIRKAEREKVLQMLIKFKESEGKHDGYVGVVLDPIIVSLRSHQAGDQHESTIAKEE